MNLLADLFASAQQWLFEAAAPVLFFMGLGNFMEDAYDASGWLIVGLLQIAVMLLVFGPLQRWRPVEPVTDRTAIRSDVVYTLIHRLGVFRVALFFLVDPFFDELFGSIRAAGYGTLHLDQILPGFTDIAWVSFLIYLVVFDFAAYWIHRGQHQLAPWWSLHSLHHSQRQMTMWSDNRNHLLDDLFVDSLLVLFAQAIGVAPGQFIAIVALTQLSESLQHANVRLGFGWLGERLWVSPRFHRIHHSIGLGHESPVKSKAFNPSSLHASMGSAQPEVKSVGVTRPGGHNFGVLLPFWDVLFGTADFDSELRATGIRDQLQEPPRDYGNGILRQQWLGLKRLFGRA
ncbi:MAG: sterol desaturase family protein [Pseudomonadota bacterium]